MTTFEIVSLPSFLIATVDFLQCGQSDRPRLNLSVALHCNKQIRPFLELHFSLLLPTQHVNLSLSSHVPREGEDFRLCLHCLSRLTLKQWLIGCSGVFLTFPSEAPYPIPILSLDLTMISMLTAPSPGVVSLRCHQMLPPLTSFQVSVSLGDVWLPDSQRDNVLKPKSQRNIPLLSLACLRSFYVLS